MPAPVTTQIPGGSAREALPTHALKKALELEADQASALIQMADAQQGLGTRLNTLA